MAWWSVPLIFCFPIVPFSCQNQPVSILKIPAEVVGSFQGDYEPADFTRVGSTKSGYPNGGASYAGGDDEFDQSDDDQQAQVGGTLDFDDGNYDCESISTVEPKKEMVVTLICTPNCVVVGVLCAWNSHSS